MGIETPRTIGSSFYTLVLDKLFKMTHYGPRRTEEPPVLAICQIPEPRFLVREP
jgi:hypothetical protein